MIHIHNGMGSHVGIDNLIGQNSCRHTHRSELRIPILQKKVFNEHNILILSNQVICVNI
jgi:hypothetical protein